MFVGYAFMIAAASFNVAHHASYPATLPVSVVPTFVYTFGMATAMPSMMLLVLDPMPERRGLASSIIGFAQSGSSAILAGAISHQVSGTAQSLAFWLGYLARVAS